MRHKATVRGLTTAASLWVVAGIGLAIGSGFIIPAVFTAFIAIMTLILLPKVEGEIKKDKYITMKILIAGQEHFLDKIRSILEKYSLKLQTYKFEKDIPKNEIMYDLNVRYKDEDTLILASNDMTKAIRDIKKLGWE